MKQKHLIAVAAGILALIAFGAGAAAMMKNNEPQKTAVEQSSTRHEEIRWNNPPAQVAAQPACDDDNIVGKLAGGVVGGIAGSQIGSGKGKTAATIGGAVGGSLLGEEYIPTQNVTCK